MDKKVFFILMLLLSSLSFAQQQQDALFLSFKMNSTAAALVGYAAGKAVLPDYALQPPSESVITVKILDSEKILQEIRLSDPREVVIEYYDVKTQTVVSNHTVLSQAFLQVVLPAQGAEKIVLLDKSGQTLASIDLVALNLASPEITEFDVLKTTDSNREVAFWAAVAFILASAATFVYVRLKQSGD